MSRYLGNGFNEEKTGSEERETDKIRAENKYRRFRDERAVFSRHRYRAIDISRFPGNRICRYTRSTIIAKGDALRSRSARTTAQVDSRSRPVT